MSASDPNRKQLAKLPRVRPPRAAAILGPTDTYQLFSANGQTIGGMFTKRPEEQVPYWLYYFNIGDIDAAAERVKTGGRWICEGPFEVPDEWSIERQVDHQASRLGEEFGFGSR